MSHAPRFKGQFTSYLSNVMLTDRAHQMPGRMRRSEEFHKVSKLGSQSFKEDAIFSFLLVLLGTDIVGFKHLHKVPEGCRQKDWHDRHTYSHQGIGGLWDI